MTTHTLAQTLTNVRQTIGRYAWWLGLSLVVVVAALAAYRSVSPPAVSIPEVRSAEAPAARLDSAQQSVMDYLRVHSSERASRAAPSLDAAQQSVMEYLRAHSIAQPLSAPATSLDSAQQSVMDYLRAHGAVHTRPLDPATQSVLDNLRAHSR